MCRWCYPVFDTTQQHGVCMWCEWSASHHAQLQYTWPAIVSINKTNLSMVHVGFRHHLHRVWCSWLWHVPMAFSHMIKQQPEAWDQVVPCHKDCLARVCDVFEVPPLQFTFVAGSRSQQILKLSQRAYTWACERPLERLNRGHRHIPTGIYLWGLGVRPTDCGLQKMLNARVHVDTEGRFY